MTREEAIRIIKIVLIVAEEFEITVQGEEFTEEKCKEAVDMAVEALQHEPCEDCISRQAVAEVLLKYAHSAEGKAFAEFLISQINDLPPVTPQYTDAEIQKMQDLEFAEIQKAYEIGKAEGSEVLDKIRAEIEAKCCITVGRENDGAITLHDVFEIIDKYKASPIGAESEDKE